jgi:hypothetical protein
MRMMPLRDLPSSQHRSVQVDAVTVRKLLLNSTEAAKDTPGKTSPTLCCSGGSQ